MFPSDPRRARLRVIASSATSPPEPLPEAERKRIIQRAQEQLPGLDAEFDSRLSELRAYSAAPAHRSRQGELRLLVLAMTLLAVGLLAWLQGAELVGPVVAVTATLPLLVLSLRALLRKEV